MRRERSAKREGPDWDDLSMLVGSVLQEQEPKIKAWRATAVARSQGPQYRLNPAVPEIDPRAVGTKNCDNPVATFDFLSCPGRNSYSRESPGHPAIGKKCGHDKPQCGVPRHGVRCHCGAMVFLEDQCVVLEDQHTALVDYCETLE